MSCWVRVIRRGTNWTVCRSTKPTNWSRFNFYQQSRAESKTRQGRCDSIVCFSSKFQVIVHHVGNRGMNWSHGTSHPQSRAERNLCMHACMHAGSLACAQLGFHTHTAQDTLPRERFHPQWAVSCTQLTVKVFLHRHAHKTSWSRQSLLETLPTWL